MNNHIRHSIRGKLREAAGNFYIGPEDAPDLAAAPGRFVTTPAKVKPKDPYAGIVLPEDTSEE